MFLMKRIESFTRWLASVCSQPDQSVLSLVSCLPAPMVMALGERKGGLSRNPLAWEESHQWTLSPCHQRAVCSCYRNVPTSVSYCISNRWWQGLLWAKRNGWEDSLWGQTWPWVLASVNGDPKKGKNEPSAAVRESDGWVVPGTRWRAQ